MILKPHPVRWRPVVENITIVALAICIARYEPAKRFYARHVPVWAARGSQNPKSITAARIVAGARAQIGAVYDSDYLPISYPGGDVPPDRGACSDVVVRALRNAGVDLQQLVHEYLLADGAAYPRLNPTFQPDANIDHRRALIQMRFFERHGTTLTNDVSTQTLAQWQPGDFVYWSVAGNRQHVGVLSDRIDASAIPLVIHNGGVCLEQDCLTQWKIIGHYRFPIAESIPSEAR